jgi:1,4-dihydroxy-2-naphthoate octaprenyltransferase
VNKLSLSSFLRISNPGLLAAGALFYSIGAAVADYLGLPVDRARLVLGWLAVTTVLLVGQYLDAYFSNLPKLGGTPQADAAHPVGASRRVPLYAAIVVAGLLAILLSGLAIQRNGPLGSWLLLGLGILLAFAYGVPPLRLATSGYGELVASIGLAGLVPSYAFAMQTGEMHRLVWLATAPLVALTFAMLITRRLSDYAGDLLRERRTLLVRLGWLTGMRLHDAAILAAAVLLAAALAGGLPSRIGIGSLIVLPLAAAQIWQVRRIRNGYPPHWRSLALIAGALLALTAYFILTGFLLS